MKDDNVERAVEYLERVLKLNSEHIRDQVAEQHSYLDRLFGHSEGDGDDK